MNIKKFVIALVAVIIVSAFGTTTASAQNVIYGQALGSDSRGSEWPLPSSYYWTYVALYRVEASGSKSWINGTNYCEGCQGFVDAYGGYQFQSDWNGNALLDGTYEAQAWANGWAVSRVRFNVSDGGTVRNELQIKSVWSQVLKQASYIDNNGGSFWVRLQIFNADANSSSMEAHAIINGPTRTTLNTTYQVKIGEVPIPEGRWNSLETTVEVKIDASMPDGEWYCVNFKLGPPSEPVSETWACAPKGIDPGYYPQVKGN